MKKNLITLCILLLCVLTIEAQQIAIPDQNFEKVLINQGIDTGALDGFISQIDAEAFTGILNISAIEGGSTGDTNKITNLTGIEAFINITGIDASPNGAMIDTMNLSFNTELSYLNLIASVQLETIDLSNNTKLTEVYISPNSPSVSFTAINLANLNKLEVLELSQSEFTSIDLSDCSALTSLNLAGCNNITTLDLLSNVNLRTLFLTYCSSLNTLSNIPNVMTFNVHNCAFTELDLSTGSNLDTIDVSNNKLRTLNVKNGFSSDITRLDSRGNPNLLCITVNDTASAVTNPNWLEDNTNVYTDQICDLVYIPDTEFERRLIASGVDTTGVLDNYILQSDAEAVTGTLNVRVRVATQMTDLTGIESFINIEELAAGNDSDAIAILDLSNNKELRTIDLLFSTAISNFDFRENTKLKDLSLGGASASINSVNVRGVTSLERVYIEDGGYTTLDFSTNTGLKDLELESPADLVHLDLSNNSNLEIVQIKTAPKLEVLNLDNLRKLKTIRFQELGVAISSIDLLAASATLEDININRNTNLNSITLGEVPALKSIDIIKNPLLTGVFDFSSAVNVRTVELNENNITGINIKNGFNTEISRFRITENPNLFCVEVDDPVFSSNSGKWSEDAHTAYTNQICDLVYIPDTEFERRLIAAGADTSGILNGYILRSDAESVTGTLNVRVRVATQMTDLTGIESFINIEGLAAGNDSDAIAILDLSNNKELRTIDLLFSTAISNFDFRENTKLKDLSLGGASASINSVNVTGVTSLERVYIEDRGYTTLDFSTNTGLKDLELESPADLVDLDLSNNSNLEIVQIKAAPKLEVLNLDNLRKLKTIRLQEFGVAISSIDLSAASATLEEININRNTNLNSIALGEVPALKSIDIIKNPLLTGVFDFSSAINVRTIELNENNITGINIKNGFNTEISRFRITENPNLFCVEVDDPAFSSNNGRWSEDAHTNYTMDCEFEEAFVTTWKTDNPGGSDDNQITIPIANNENYDYTIDWGDGNRDTNITTSITHTYDNVGIYRVTITGIFPRIYFDGASDTQKIIDVNQWGNTVWSAMKFAFKGCKNLKVTATDAPDLSAVDRLTGMFLNCASMNNTLNHWDVSTIQDFAEMFSGASTFNQDLDSWNTSNANTMRSMFKGASSFNGDITTWDTSNVTNMSNLFRTTSFNRDIGNWNTSKVVKMDWMFNGCNAFNQDIGRWDTSSVEIISRMFSNATSFNQDISGWDVSNVSDFYAMFSHATSFDQDLGLWNITNATAMRELFNNTNISVTNYDNTLIGWLAQEPVNAVELDASGLQYCLGKTARNILMNTHGWSINDRGIATSCQELTIDAKVLLEGAFLNSAMGEEELMRDDLRTAGLIPVVSPYKDGLTCNATVFDTTGDDAIVDWVWITLRDDTSILAEKSALLQRDGDVVAIDGISLLSFSGFEGAYFLTIEHRNHLGIMTANKINLSSTTAILDFSRDNTIVTGGANALIDMGNDLYAMPSGDYDSNGQVQNIDINPVIQLLGNSEYNNADMDMNGQIQNADINTIIYKNLGKGEQF